MRETPELRWLAWEITARCNLACVHCRSSSSYAADSTEFSLDEARAFIDEVVSFAKPVLVLTGGEPLLRRDWPEIARYGTERGLRVCIATNGTLLTPETCRTMKEVGIRMVSLSLDGATAETHDDFRRQAGAFEGAVRAAGILKQGGVEFLVNSSFTRRNRHEIPGVFELAKSLGATAWYLFMIVPTGRAKELLDELIPADEYNEILEWHYETELGETEILMRPTCAPHYYRILHQRAAASGAKVERRNLKFATGKSRGCLAGQWIALVDHRGDVHPCSYFARTAGNVHEQPFREIWAGSPLLADLRDFDKYKGKCGYCEFLRVCGGCRARADAIYGDYMREEPFCDYHPERKRGKMGTR